MGQDDSETMTCCYELTIDNSEISITYELAPVKEPPSPFPTSWWSGLRDLEYSYDGCFGPITRKELANQWVQVNPRIEELPDVMGIPYPDGRPPLIVRRALKEAIENTNPGNCDFVKAGPIWDRRFHRELLDQDYYFMAIQTEVDSWDREQSSISEINRSDGTSFFTINSPRIIRSKAIGQNLLWRDALTGTVLCSETFKLLAEQAGCRGLAFWKLEQTET
ncbi:hypothetical protein GP644_11880 [Parasedimentitalea maritima]|uniref:Immunity MXAN-0049 protein domain-containing protein n=2 Tax=Parasedimentitalea maritima TaxID=2578117 RepID=A0A6A4RIJ3_9RHOB|nr:hypothetical protein GP644_11880 [Zongyanglinia marina]